MDCRLRKDIYFDLDTEALKKYYPKGDWDNAYYDVRSYFEKFPWLNYCVSICTISDVPELFDISHVFAERRMHPWRYQRT